MLVLNTDDVDRCDRAEAFQTMVSANCSSSMVAFEDVGSFRAKLETFELGPARVFNIDAHGNTLRRTPRMARAVNECSIVLALPMRTTNHFSWQREQRAFGPRDMILVDVSIPYVYGWQGQGASYAFHVDVEQLGLPIDTIHAAMHTVHHSPIYPLVRDHITRVTAEAATIAASSTAVEVGLASVALMQALIISAAEEGVRRRDALHASLAVRVQTYVHQHSRDPDLTPAKIARANGVSVRALYALYETLDVSLEQSIIEHRLAGARADLIDARLRHRSIESIGRSWGFTNPSFFSNRFRKSFGVTPREWRRVHSAPATA